MHFETNKPGNGIAITIDDGPIREHCDDFLAAFEAMDLRAYCFVVGRDIDKNPDLAKKLHDAGHTLCNHTYSHPHLPKLGRAEQAEEIDRGTEAVMKITGVAPCWFRFPYLDYTDDLVELVETRGMHSVGCSMYTRDPDLESTGQQIVDRLRASFREDGIVVGHHWSRATRQALAVLVPEWRATVGVGALALPGE